MPQWYTWVIAIVVGVILGTLLNRNKNKNLDAIYQLSAEDFKSNMRKGQLIDVRSKEEFEGNKIKGARNFKKAQLVGKYPKVRKDQSVYIYCNNGKKSFKVAKAMSGQGFTNIYVLEGGLNKLEQ